MQNEFKQQEGLSGIAEFILSFIQALLKTGYYKPGHPETNKAKEGLYREFKKALEGYKEITFVSAAEKNKKDVMIDGVFEETAKLSKLLLKGMSEMFVPKFLEYFERKHLTSFSMKSQITKEEFDSFINIMSETPYDENPSEDLREKMMFEMIKSNIVSVSTVFNVELVGKKRKLPWRVELALTRLKNDLSKIPLYKNLRPEKLAEIKAMVFDDIIRPVRTPELIKDILCNLDLVLYNTMGISKDELEDEVTAYFNKDCLLQAAPELLKEYLKVRTAHEQFPDDEAISKHLEPLGEITRKVALIAASYEKTEDAVLLESIKCGLLRADELPDRIRKKFRRIEAVDSFLRNPQEYYNAINKAREDEFEYRCSMFVDMIPELLSRSCYREVDEIISFVKKSGFEFSKMGKAFFDVISGDIDSIVMNSPKESQMRVMEMLGVLGKNSIPILSNLLVVGSRLVRKISCEMLIANGKDTVPHLISIVYTRNDWFFIRNVLMILAEIGQGGEAIENIFRKFINHGEQRVREEVAKGITNIMGAKGERYLLDYLKDPSISVRRKAVWGLGIIKSTSPKLLSYIYNVLQGKTGEDETMIEQALFALSLIGEDINESEDFEKSIIKMLKGKGVIRILTSKAAFSDKVKIRACEALGTFGTKKSISVLKMFKNDKNKNLREAVERSIEQISSRYGN